MPADWLGGVRCIGGVTLFQTLFGNVGTQMQGGSVFHAPMDGFGYSIASLTGYLADPCHTSLQESRGRLKSQSHSGYTPSVISGVATCWSRPEAPSGLY